MSINQIDFIVDDHIVQFLQNVVLIFKDSDASKQPISIGRSDLLRICKIAEESFNEPNN